MATLVLSAAGAAIGGAVGGSVIGLSSAVIGKAIGASIGASIDQKLLGSGSQAVETGRIDQFRVMGASEGAAMAQVFGQMRLGGHVIWSSRFNERKTETTQGSKSNRTTVVSYAYSVSLAIALCEGEITRIGRVWADGNEISLDGITWRLYLGTEDQQPDQLIEAIEGTGQVPAYRGTAYIVFEDLELAPFGNRIPQFNFEVIRRVKELGTEPTIDPFDTLRAVALIPGTGEYALATTPVTYKVDKGVSRTANQNNTSGQTDLGLAMEQLKTDLPKVNSVSMVVSWFGDDLRAGHCTLRPKVEQRDVEGDTMPWAVTGLTRSTAEMVSRIDGASVFGGTACDASVIEAITKFKADGLEVMFYPFILMDIGPGNGLPNPYGGGDQPVFPWRGRITLDAAPGQPGSLDQTAAAEAEVAAFFGSAQVSDFVRSGGHVSFSGDANDWGYRRFILHYAHLCAEAGGIETFIIGSEMRGITQIRGAGDSFPAVEAFRQLADDVREILGPSAKISYAADWSEYFGYHPQDGSGDVWFHLDPLWASENVDFVGIDNYMPLSDWRDSFDHLDAGFTSIYNLDYLEANVAGGEGYDWYYASAEDRDAQIRTPIVDGGYDEHWVFRYKDLKAWWGSPHHNRLGGVRAASSTDWVPQSKPIRFTELGCAAIDKGTNQPNVFVDAKSSENFIPYHSTGAQDDFIQYRYFQAHLQHWGRPENNPVSLSYGQPMVDMNHAYIWAFDTRPWPDFPARTDIWSDGTNYGRGHWVSGRIGSATLAAVVTQIAARANFYDVDVSALHGSVRGYMLDEVQSGRHALQPLMLSHGFECAEIDGKIVFKNRLGSVPQPLDKERVVDGGRKEPVIYARSPDLDLSSQVQVNFYHSENAYQIGAAAAGIPQSSEPTTTRLDVPVALSGAEGGAVAARFLSEAYIARDEVTFTLPPSLLGTTVGDIITFESDPAGKLYRIDRLEETGARTCFATRVEHGVYQTGGSVEQPITTPTLAVRVPPYVEFLDLPLITGAEIPHAPFIAATASPWLGAQSIFLSPEGENFELGGTIAFPSIVGTTTSPLLRAEPDLWARSGQLGLRVPVGTLSSRSELDVLSGANLAALRAPGARDWELFQFANAELVAPQTYMLSHFLRGQLGTDALMRDVMPAGSDFVLLDGGAVQPDLPLTALGLLRHYRIGPEQKPYDDPSYQAFVERFDGAGLRPLSPKHLRPRWTSGGDLELRWVRRTRIGGDSWEGADVPLGEEREAYLVRVTKDGTLVREVLLETNSYTYSQADQAGDGIAAPFDLEIAQISALYGPGPFERITIDG